MGWNARAAHLVRRLSVALCAALIVCVVGAVYAAGARVYPRVSNYVPSGTNPVTGARTFHTQTEFGAFWENALGGAVSRTVTAAGEISSTTIGSLGRKAIRGGVYGAAVGLAIEGIIDGAGWAIDELKKQVVSGPPAATEVPPGRNYYVGSDGKFYSTLLAAATASVAARNSTNGEYSYSFKFLEGCQDTLCSFMMTRTQPSHGSSTDIRDFVAMRVNEDVRPVPVDDLQPAPVTDQQLGDALRDHPELVNDLLTDPRTGSPIMTPELQQQADKIKQDIDQREGIGDGSPNPVVTPPLDDDTAQPTETDWPSFCGWATVVCDFIDWVKKDDSPTKEPLPERDLDIDPNSWTSGVGEGACPSPQQFNITVAGYAASGEYSFQPLCDFASQLKPFLILVASIVAVMILAGLRSTSAK
ncbi:virulence factor TspB C-terminal domain-related protein [Xanthomonas campestris]|uniref:virulence factor TspB C-terminal domain-related protein n=1 Tax=Xanthomonas campestris TaxID=339 RepID=UPI0012FD95FD|nr:virulence factor TspB C-terminal domain-related protein [Xanthomonas campestris]